MGTRGHATQAAGHASSKSSALARILITTAGVFLSAFPAAWACGLSSRECSVSIAAPTSEAATHSRESWVATVRMAAPADEVWSVLTDFSSWPEFFPGVSSIAVATTEDERISLTTHSEAFGFEIQYTTLTRVDSLRRRVEQTLDPRAHNDIDDVKFVWQLIPINGGRSTVAVLRSQLDSGRPLPAFVEQSLIKRGVQKSVEALAHEVEQRKSESMLALAK